MRRILFLWLNVGWPLHAALRYVLVSAWRRRTPEPEPIGPAPGWRIFRTRCTSCGDECQNIERVEPAVVRTAWQCGRCWKMTAREIR